MLNVRNLQYRWYQKHESSLSDLYCVEYFNGEADVYTFDYKRYHGVILRHEEMGHLCGYLGITEDDIIASNNTKDEIARRWMLFHGGCTLEKDGGKLGEHFHHDKYYFGFDCGHLGDWTITALIIGSSRPVIYRNAGFVMWQIIQIAELFNEALGLDTERVGITYESKKAKR